MQDGSSKAIALTYKSSDLSRYSSNANPCNTIVRSRLNRIHTRLGIVEKLTYPELPPRVEYHLTPFGQEFAEILDQIEALQQKFKMDSDRSTENLKPPSHQSP